MPRHSRLLTWMLAALPTVTACPEPQGAAAGDPSAPWDIESATVLFTARRAGNADLHVLRLPDALPTRLTSDAAVDNFGRYSPDGRRIAFQSHRSGAIDLFVMTATGDSLSPLVADSAYDVLPAWSPDGARIAFMSTRGYALGSIGPFPGHIYVVDADGTGRRQLTREPLTSSLGPQDWAPDGRTILLSREIGGQLDLFALDVATGHETRLTAEPVDEYGAAFARDGTRIAFHAEADGVSQIVIMHRDGTGRRAVTAGPGLRYGPRWSPDDTWLLFAMQGTGERDYDLWAVRVADGLLRPIAVTPDDEREGDWAVGSLGR